MPKTEIILAQKDDGPLKWANDPYIPFKVMQISKILWALCKIFMGPLQNLMGPRILKLISTLEQNSHEI